MSIRRSSPESRTRGASRRLAALLVLTATGLFGCRRASLPSEVPQERPQKQAHPADDGAPGLLHAERFGVAPAGTFGPYLGASAQGAIALWAEIGEAGGNWYTVSLGNRAEPLRIADAADEIGLAAVRPGPDHGFLVVTSSSSDAGTRVDALALGAEGELRRGPVPLASGLGDLVWLDVFHSGKTTLAMWALKGEGSATIFAQPLGDGGEPREAPTEVAKGAVAWQAVITGTSVALACVTHAEKVEKKRQGSAGTGTGTSTGNDVALVYVNADGGVESRLSVHENGTAENDIDMVALGDRLLLAWSDRSSVQSLAMLAVVDGQGKLLGAPHPAVPALGDQAVIQLLAAPGAQHAVLGFEELAATKPGRREVRLVPVSRDGSAGSKGGIMSFYGDRLPELAATAKGVAALTLAPACPRGKPCDEPPVATFVELDERFALRASEPLRLDALDGGFAELAWGLSCGGKGCFALIAESTAPATMWTVDLERQSDAWEPAASVYALPPPPRARSAKTVDATEPLSAVDIVRTKSGPLGAWITYFDPNTAAEKPSAPAPDGRLEPVRARLSVRPLDAGDDATQVISYRARSLGGVSIAAAGPDADRALLVWSALDANQPHVFTTLVDAKGKKLVQKMLTKVSGEVTDTAATFVGDGWIVAWVDERAGYPQVFVTKLDQRLNRIAPDVAVTRSPGSATGVALLELGDSVLVARADARGDHPGSADIYLVEVSKKDASVVGEEVRLTSNATHSHSPKLGRLGKQVIVGWLESNPGKSAGAFTGAVSLGVYSPDLGQLEGVAELQGAPDVAPTSVALECDDLACHVMMLVETSGNAEFHGFTWTPEASPEIVRVMRLMGRPNDVVAPAISGNLVLFADSAEDGKGRVRQATIEWR